MRDTGCGLRVAGYGLRDTGCGYFECGMRISDLKMLNVYFKIRLLNSRAANRICC
ncbi:hypothetical protein D1BOALGB6SA_293 [Olavius sp. associated proteobacterium Delta 1]|nr:hypothetical protein D1BOALGB6SA_293 [Olavius sp. associated proteobacterium Delta 1]